jgi:hypothetical protein
VPETASNPTPTLPKPARQVAPQQVRYHPMARETVLAIAHAEPRPNEELRSFAAWLGIDP